MSSAKKFPQEGVIYRLTLKDKQGTPYCISHPEQFLSQKAIERRQRQGLAIDSTDLPISPCYIKEIEKCKLKVLGGSKWNNTVLTWSPDSLSPNSLEELPFVVKIQQVWAARPNNTNNPIYPKREPDWKDWDFERASIYGLAGSATNFSNHAYKMGPLHWGVLERGAKTASGAHLLMPAHIGAFSVCMGKIASHPDTRTFPFSYIIQDGYQTLIVPGRNLTTVGLYRDVNKWPKRDQRPQEGRKSLIHFDWLSPAIVNEIVSGKHILERLQQSCGTECDSYSYRHCTIKASSLRKGLAFYNMALHLYMGKVLLKAQEKGFGFPPANNIGAGHWSDLAGLYLPESEEQHLVSNIKNGDFETIQEVNERFVSLFKAYPEYEWRWAYQLIRDQYGFETIGNDEQQHILNDYKKAKSMWIDAIKKDAEKEFALGDVAPDVLKKFIQTLPETNKQEL